MTIDWIKKEIKKNSKDIDWLGISNTAKAIYLKNNESKSVLGLGKGFVNFINSSSYDFRELKAELYSIYKEDELDIIDGNYQSTVNNLIQSGRLSNLKEKIVIIHTDKYTIEKLFLKNNIPYIRYSTSMSTKRYKDSNDKDCYLRTFRWKKDDEKVIKWEKGQAISFKRNTILEDLLDS